MEKNTSKQYTKSIIQLLAQAIEADELQICGSNIGAFMEGMLSATTYIHNSLADKENQINNQEMTYKLNRIVLKSAILDVDKDYFTRTK